METKLVRNNTNQALFIYDEIKVDENGKEYFIVKNVRPYAFAQRIYLEKEKSVEAYIKWLKKQGFKIAPQPKFEMNFDYLKK